MKRTLLLTTILVLSTTAGRAAAEGAPRSAYQLSWELDAPILLIAGGMAAGFLVLDEGAPPACAPVCDRSKINWLDRPFAGEHSPTWQTVGDVATAATLVLVPAGLIAGEPNRAVFRDLLVVGEAVLITSALQVQASFAVGRPRPRVYGENAPLDERTDANAARSFFSGHAANCLAGTMVASTALFRTGHRGWGWAVLSVGLAGSAIVGVSRVGAGGHFPSDVLIGYAVGAGVGIALPALHTRKLELGPLADARSPGLAVSGRF